MAFRVSGMNKTKYCQIKSHLLFFAVIFIIFTGCYTVTKIDLNKLGFGEPYVYEISGKWVRQVGKAVYGRKNKGYVIDFMKSFENHGQYIYKVTYKVIYGEIISVSRGFCEMQGDTIIFYDQSQEKIRGKYRHKADNTQLHLQLVDGDAHQLSYKYKHLFQGLWNRKR